MPAPIIVLVAPQMGENIGAAARAMGNFGLSELRVVNPRDGWPNEAAQAMAAHAREIVDNATIYETLDDAIADCQQIYATSARLRDMNKSTVTAREFATSCDSALKTAILLGRENSGLTNDEVAKAHKLLTIPVDESCPSINLAQAVVVVAYEWFQAQQPDNQFSYRDEPPAPLQELEGFITQLESELDSANFWKVEDKKPRMLRNIRNLFLRSEPTTQEVQTLRGILSALSSPSK